MPYPKGGSTEQRVVAPLFAVARAIAAEIRRAGASSQLTAPQFSALRLLDGEDWSVGGLAKTLRVSMPTVTQSADSLVGKGLVERYSDERDRRLVRLRITPEGRSLYRHCRKEVDRYVRHMLSALPEQGKEELASTLEAIALQVEEALLVR